MTDRPPTDPTDPTISTPAVPTPAVPHGTGSSSGAAASSSGGLTVTDARLAGRSVSIRCADGVIVDIGPDVTAAEGDAVLDAEGMPVVPGLVNGHTHAAMTLFRGYGSDHQLQEWLSEWIWPAEALLTEEDCYWGTRLAAAEMLRSGTTHFFDMYWHPEAAARACEDAGIRATVGAPLFDGGNAAGLGALRDTALESLEALSGFGPLITPSLTPHAPYTVSLESLAWVAETAAARQLTIHIHCAETIREVDDWMAAHDQRLAFVLDDLGLLGPRTLLAHGCVMDGAEYERVGERGTTIVTNPVSNLKLASGKVFPYVEAVSHGVPVGLGTDGASSNNGLDLFADLRTFAIIQKHAEYDPTVLPAAEALAVAQGRRSPLLGGRPVEAGAPADFLLLRTDLPQMNPGSVVDNLVYATSGEVVDTTVVAGRVVMRHRHVTDEEEIITEARARADRLRVHGRRPTRVES